MWSWRLHIMRFSIPISFLKQKRIDRYWWGMFHESGKSQRIRWYHSRRKMSTINSMTNIFKKTASLTLRLNKVKMYKPINFFPLSDGITEIDIRDAALSQWCNPFQFKMFTCLYMIRTDSSTKRNAKRTIPLPFHKASSEEKGSRTVTTIRI